jgi:hypothetical protein
LPNNITIGSSNVGGILASFSAVDNQDNTYTITWTTLGDSTPQSLTFSRASAPTITGAWNGSGTYQVRSDGTVVLTTTPSLTLSGNGSTSFSAVLMSDTASPVAQSSKYGYLHITGSGTASAVGVYSSRSGSGASSDPYTYSGLVASQNVGSVYTSGINAGHDSVTLSEIQFHNNSSSTSDTEPTEDPRWTGGTINGYIWSQQSDGKWKNLGYRQYPMPTTATWTKQQVSTYVYNVTCTVGGKAYTTTISL